MVQNESVDLRIGTTPSNKEPPDSAQKDDESTDLQDQHNEENKTKASSKLPSAVQNKNDDLNDSEPNTTMSAVKNGAELIDLGGQNKMNELTLSPKGPSACQMKVNKLSYQMKSLQFRTTKSCRQQFHSNLH